MVWRILESAASSVVRSVSEQHPVIDEMLRLLDYLLQMFEEVWQSTSIEVGFVIIGLLVMTRPEA